MGAACGGGKKAESAVVKQLPLPGDDFVQRVAVVRHANREDHLHPAAWFGSPEGQRHPYDTPITFDGEERARSVGEKAPDAFDVIVCSPYMRCLMTGCEIAKIKKIPIMFDNGLGEIFDDTYMPQNNEGKKQIRRPKALGEFLKREYPGVKAIGHDPKLPFLKVYGPHPVFPEDWRKALARFEERFEHILTECARRRLHPIIVTHADAVVNLFEAITGSSAEKVDYCGWFVGERRGGAPESIWSEGWKWEVGDYLRHGPAVNVTSFDPIKKAVAQSREEMQKASAAYPTLEFPDWLAAKNSEDEKVAAMDEFWTPAQRQTVAEDKEKVKLTFRDSVHVIELLHKLQRKPTDRFCLTPVVPETCSLHIEDDEENEDDMVLYKSAREKAAEGLPEASRA
jgi:broad specificity phosphatase PhoE